MRALWVSEHPLWRTRYLIQFLGQQAAGATESLKVNDQDLTPVQQQEYLTDLASKQNLVSRQLKRCFQNQIHGQQVVNVDTDLHLIHPLPNDWRVEVRVSYSGLKLIPDFTGDTIHKDQFMH